jgi:4-alpha-glucanotransferase
MARRQSPATVAGSNDSPVLSRWTDAYGTPRGVSARTRAALLAAMRGRAPSRRGGLDPIILGRRGAALPAGSELILEDGTDLGWVLRVPHDAPFGYHRLTSNRGEQLLIVAPARCALPAGYREWAWAVQLYAARSRASWGIGDFADLGTFAAWSRQVGAGALIVSPMGAPNPGPAPEASPYFASTRRFRDPLLIAVETVPGAGAVAATITPLTAEGRRLNRRRLIDRRAALALKRAALEAIWGVGSALVGEHRERLRRFAAAGGGELRGWATFATLSEELGSDWRKWPEPYRDPASPSVARYAETHAERIGFHTWVQWLADEQLAKATVAGPRIIADLPVGFDPGGFDAWDWQAVLAEGVSIGAPPDPFNLGGQNWGLPPFIPQRLREVRLQPFIATLRAALRHAGGLRIDHVLGLFRLWWVPGNAPADQGAYVRYPVDELLAVLAIESVRADAIIVGEDLGTVGPGVRARLAAHGVLSTRLTPFERRRPHAYPRRVLAAITNHDLPTIAGAWTGRDLDDQRAAGIDADARQIAWWRNRIASLAGLPPTARIEDVILAAHRTLAASPACLVSATLEDALRVAERPNIPGTGPEQRANWSLALSAPLERLISDPFVANLAKAMRGGRAAAATPWAVPSLSPRRAAPASRAAEAPAPQTPAAHGAQRARR